MFKMRVVEREGTQKIAKSTERPGGGKDQPPDSTPIAEEIEGRTTQEKKDPLSKGWCFLRDLGTKAREGRTG